VTLDDFVQRFLDDPNSEETIKDDIQSLMTSHLVTGMKLQRQGLLREAIDEFAKENNRPTNSDIDKEIVQNSYVYIGVAYRELGKFENAKASFEKAYELWKQFGVGSMPHYDLAEILIEQGNLDDAIALCKELLTQVPSKRVKQLLAKALQFKKETLG